MAYPQQARYGPGANYYEAPRSAPLKPPQEYAQDSYNYGPSQHQQAYAYNGGHQNGQYNERQGQYRAQQPTRPAPRQYQQPPQDMGTGRQEGAYGGNGDLRGVNGSSSQAPREPYTQPNAGHAYGGQGRAMQGGHGPRNPAQGSQRTAYGQQGFQDGFQGQYQDPYNNLYQAQRPRPVPQRSFSAGPGSEANQSIEHVDHRSGRPAQPPMPQKQSQTRAAPQINPATAPKKKEKERIIRPAPSSPDTLPWDNPFPTFPGVHEKKAAKAEGSRPQTAASSRRSHESSRSVDRESHATNYPREQHVVQQYLAPQYQPIRPAQPIQGKNARQEPAFKHHPNVNHTVSRPQPGDGHAGPFAVAMPPPEPSYANREHRSNTLPNEVSQTMIQGNFPLRPNNNEQPTVAELQQHNPLPQPQNAYQRQQSPPSHRHYGSNSYDTGSVYSQSTRPSNDIPRDDHQVVPASARRPSGSSQRSKTPQLSNNVKNQYAPQQPPSRSNTPGSSQGYKQAYAQSTPAFHHAANIPEERHADVVDDCFEEPGPSKFKPFRGPPVTSSPVAEDNEDMPNFDNALSSPTHDKVLHLGAQQNHSPSHVEDSAHGRSGAGGPTNKFASQAHRSRSQPNLRDQNSSPNDFAGFDFGIGKGPPHMPPTNPQYTRQSPNQPYRRSPPMSQFQGEWQQPRKGSFDPPKRSFTEGHGPGTGGSSQVPGSGQKNSSRPQQFMGGSGMGPPMGPGPGPPPGARNGPGPGPMGRPPPHNGPPPLSNPRAVSEGSQRHYGSQGRSPANEALHNSNRSQNPDVLPAHPAPARPGLMHQSQSPPINQQNPSRPPPVRQYNASSPGTQASIAPPPTQPGPAPVTYAELQRLKGLVQSNPNDQNSQMILVKKLVEAASVLADEGGHADPKTKAKNREKYVLEAHKIVKKLVGIGNTEAMFYLADCYGSGHLGQAKDPKEAFQLYQSAAKLNHAQSAYRVAVCCEIGLEEGGGTRRDPVKAIQWYQRAAQLGDVPAMYKLGVVQLKGLLGQPRNAKGAVSWLQKAAERADEENPHALHELGLLYQNPVPADSIARDDVYARQLFTRAADLGYKFSQFKLGQAYEQAQLGFQQNARLSIMWYSKAAMQEEHQSELGLSGWYLTGAEGVLQQNDTEAYLWARKAAQAGLAKAEYAMGYFTEVGIGAPADMEGAKRWYWKAASQNFPKARERLEDLRSGGSRIQKTRVSRSAINKPEGDCKVM